MEEKKERNTTIDVIKGICMILVVLTHSKYSDSFYRYALFPFWVNCAVTVFMFLSGYVRSMNMPDLRESYSWNRISKQLFRLLLPFLPLFFVEELISLRNYFSIGTIFLDILDGGHGPGSYYVSLMVQFVFVFPVLYHVVKKYDKKGLAICLGVDLCYEIVKSAISLPTSVYRTLVFRYLFVIAWGVYEYIHRKDQLKYAYILIGIGFVYIMVCEYLGYTVLFFDQWSSTALPAALFWIPILILIMKKYQLHNYFLELAGKASYHIFLVQMFYFRYLYPHLGLDLHFLVMMLINTVICFSTGIIFYMAEKYLLKSVKNSRTVRE